tara:strand:+ start:712 stop:1323 length:612 start_codon:yes stop_codon:yes gene_type:complete
MSDESLGSEQATDAGGVTPEQMLRHENDAGITQEDVPMVAHFAKMIGNELYTVDHQNVGGTSNQNIKALKLDHKKIFAGVETARAAKQQQSAPGPQRPLEQPVTPNPVAKKTGPVSPAPPLPAPSAPLSDEVDRRLSKLERATKTLRNAKRIKRGTSYTVSSNSFKGVIRDAELLAEYIISEVAKGVKSITIKRNDSKDTEQK